MNEDSARTLSLAETDYVAAAVRILSSRGLTGFMLAEAEDVVLRIYGPDVLAVARLQVALNQGR